MIFGDRFENCAQLRDIPLTIFNLINQMSPDILIDELEDLIESPARSNDAQLLVEHQKRVADGIDDRTRERGGVWNGGEGASVFFVLVYCELSASLSNEGNTARIFFKSP